MENKSTEQQVFLPVSPEVTAAMVAQRCREDADYRKRLEEDAKTAVFEGQEKQPPAHLKVTVHENTPDCWHIAIPSDQQIDNVNKVRTAMQGDDSEDLADEQLQDLSGGFEIWIAALISVSIGVGVGAAGATAAGLAIADRRGRL